VRALPLLLLAGCATSGESLILEYWDEAADRRAARVVDDADGLRETNAWIASAYRPPRAPELMGAVLPRAAILRGSEILWVYESGSHQENDVIVPRKDVDALCEIFQRRGRGYDGPARSGGFRSIHDPDSPLRSSSPPIKD